MKKENVEEMIKPEKDAVKTKKASKEKKEKKAKEPKVGGMSSDTKVILGIVGGMIVICAALIFYYFFGVNNQVLATYEGGTVTRGEYTIYYKLFQPMLTYYGYTEDAIKEEVLNKVVIDEIVVAKAEKEDIKISDENKDEIEKMFEDEEEVASYIEQGIDPEKMKQVYYDDALITAYINKITEEATEETIKKFIDETEGENANYNKYVTSYILYSKDGEDGDLEKVKANAEATLTRLKNGEAFATVGEEVYNADSTYTQYGSEFELYLNGSTVKAFEDAVRNMKTGEMTQVLVESKEYGYFIIKLDSIVANDRINGEEAANNYSNELLKKWQEDADVEIKEKRLDRVVSSLATATTSTAQ